MTPAPMPFPHGVGADYEALEAEIARLQAEVTAWHRRAEVLLVERDQARKLLAGSQPA